MGQIKHILMFCLLMPCVVYAGDVNVKDIRVPFSRIYESVRGFEPLYNSSFVYLLESRIGNNGIHLGEIAQACMDYTMRNRHVTRDMCVNFVSRIIGETIDYDANFGEIVITTTSDVSDVFSFKINASGRFKFKCSDSDGWVPIELTDVTEYNVSCVYGGAATERRIVFRGLATGYSDDLNASVISFKGNQHLAKISGDLGFVFPPIGVGENVQMPRFVSAFNGCTGLTDISPELFRSVRGVPIKNMFQATFSVCTSLTEIPPDLFNSVSGAPAEGMFALTFYGCSSLTKIPERLFENIDTTKSPARGMFRATFGNCGKLGGSPAQINGTLLHEIDAWKNCNNECGLGCYLNDTGLDNWTNMLESGWALQTN